MSGSAVAAKNAATALLSSINSVLISRRGITNAFEHGCRFCLLVSYLPYMATPVMRNGRSSQPDSLLVFQGFDRIGGCRLQSLVGDGGQGDHQRCCAGQ